MYKSTLIILLIITSFNSLAQEPVIPSFETDPVLNWNGADDPAIWVHPTNPSSSFFIGVDKRDNGRLELYNLDGTRFWSTPNGTEYNNVDVMYSFPLGDTIIDIVAATNVSNNTIDFYQIDQDNRLLIDITGDTDCGFNNLYGFILYQDLCMNKHYAFVNRRTVTGYCYQFIFTDNGNGLIDTELVRIIDNLPTKTEGMVADYRLGDLYIAEEATGIWKYSAAADAGNERILMDSVNGSNLTSLIEGLTIYYSNDTTGYLIAASQGASDYQVYTREGDNDFLGSFELIANTEAGIDQVINQDGIEVLSYPIPGFFDMGVFISHDKENTGGGFSNYKIVPWENIANALDLRIDTTFSPRDLIPDLCDTTIIDTSTNYILNNKLLSNLSIYPNPVGDLVFFEQSSRDSQIKNITIYNYLGEAIFRENRNLITPISVQFLEPGLYIIRVDNIITRFVKK